MFSPARSHEMQSDDSNYVLSTMLCLDFEIMFMISCFQTARAHGPRRLWSRLTYVHVEARQDIVSPARAHELGNDIDVVGACPLAATGRLRPYPR